METPEFANLSFIEKIIYNIENCIRYLYTKNGVLILLMLIPINNLINKKIKKKSIKIPIMIAFDTYCLASILHNLQYEFPNFEQIFILDSKKITVPFWTAYTILFLYSIIDTYKDDKKKLFMYLIIFIIGLSSIFSMLISPVWGHRISILSIFCLYIISISLICNIVKPRTAEKIEKILIGIIVCVCICYLMIFIYVAHIQNLREQEIKQCIDNNEKVLNLTKSPVALMHNYNPSDDFNIKTYKNYYNIPEDVEIRFKSSELAIMLKNFKNKILK